MVIKESDEVPENRYNELIRNSPLVIDIKMNQINLINFSKQYNTFDYSHCCLSVRSASSSL